MRVSCVAAFAVILRLPVCRQAGAQYDNRIARPTVLHRLPIVFLFPQVREDLRSTFNSITMFDFITKGISKLMGGSKSERDVKEIQPYVDEILRIYPTLKS